LYAEQGRAGLEGLPGIGSHLAYTLEGLLTTGAFRTLRPEGAQREPDRLLTSLPGIGPQLALRLRERLGITTLEALEQAARAGRLGEVGIGPRRVQTLLDALAEHNRPVVPLAGEPAVAELLRLDAEYRLQIQRLRLPTTSLLTCDGWHYRLCFARSALARRLHQTRDWVEIHFTNGTQEGQRLVVTETHGDMEGRRVVRGRERECRAHYQAVPQAALTA
jgi:DNA polymerase/3'-5' exonuclease PolX